MHQVTDAWIVGVGHSAEGLQLLEGLCAPPYQKHWHSAGVAGLKGGWCCWRKGQGILQWPCESVGQFTVGIPGIFHKHSITARIKSSKCYLIISVRWKWNPSWVLGNAWLWHDASSEKPWEGQRCEPSPHSLQMKPCCKAMHFYSLACILHSSLNYIFQRIQQSINVYLCGFALKTCLRMHQECWIKCKCLYE